ncbi:hypothetical protein ACQKGL_20305 [Ensifer adhaerens]|uniref:hypothetical protein n=1 Tax=Ensifer adhaerens TaxID=106592 RepID=UPI003CFF95F8
MKSRRTLAAVLALIAAAAFQPSAAAPRTQEQIMADLAAGKKPALKPEFFLSLAGRAISVGMYCPDAEPNMSYIQGVSDGAGLAIDFHPVFRDSFDRSQEEVKQHGEDLFCETYIKLLGASGMPILMPRVTPLLGSKGSK